jgi:monofunctional biosynthetic peptidoglycan transglycosylase
VLQATAAALIAAGATVAPSSSTAQEPPDTTVELPIPLTGTWTVVNDGVMGGRSMSTVQKGSSGTIVFAGEVSLENNGGFASARLPIPESDLSAFGGLRLRLRGDGNRYQIRLRTDDRFDGIAYSARLQTTGEWETVEIPFAAFEPTFRGARPRGAPPLDPSRIRQLGFLIADEQAGPFRLEVADVCAYVVTAAPH